ncbi:hypothetical protein BD410DRAFT_119655 [Rickenella mellea]|uniref:Uncharacterized protein n=1 Tax=Rickenella mellea TaxID=50990 RepID=A0A4Y7Q9Y6_9AGAM|nr:hypothetical protein BD410DRAFT_119655 [Rickenella mellea]
MLSRTSAFLPLALMLRPHPIFTILTPPVSKKLKAITSRPIKYLLSPWTTHSPCETTPMLSMASSPSTCSSTPATSNQKPTDSEISAAIHAWRVIILRELLPHIPESTWSSYPTPSPSSPVSYETLESPEPDESNSFSSSSSLHSSKSYESSLSWSPGPPITLTPSIPDVIKHVDAFVMRQFDPVELAIAERRFEDARITAATATTPTVRGRSWFRGSVYRSRKMKGGIFSDVSFRDSELAVVRRIEKWEGGGGVFRLGRPSSPSSP